MVGIEAEMVRDGAYELRDVLRVQLDGIDAADGHARPEQVGLVVLVDIDMRVEALAPAVLTVRCTLPLAQDLIRPERVVGHPYVGAVAGHVELAVVRAHVRRDRHPGHIVIIPVEHVGRHPRAASGAEHIVLAFPLEDTDVSRRTPLADFHRKWVAVAGILTQCLGVKQAGGEKCGDGPNDPFFHDDPCCGSHKDNQLCKKNQYNRNGFNLNDMAPGHGTMVDPSFHILETRLNRMLGKRVNP